jgi:hypothetical protein
MYTGSGTVTDIAYYKRSFIASCSVHRIHRYTDGFDLDEHIFRTCFCFDQLGVDLFG